MAFDRAAEKEGLKYATYNGDAFSDEMRQTIISKAKEMNIRFDLIVYSVASAVRVDPVSGEMYRSVLKPFGLSFVGQNIDVATNKLITISAETANPEEASQTVKVMGGEDWERWIKQLSDADVLANGVKTVAYSYIGPSLSHAIYRDGTIGKAKEHLEKTADILNEFLSSKLKGEAYVSINKGLVTRSSAVIPVIPLYLSILFKKMKEKGTHEGCIEQAERLFAERLYTGSAVPVDEKRLIRIDDLELDPEVQAYVSERMPLVTEENLSQIGDLEGYKHDFLATKVLASKALITPLKSREWILSNSFSINYLYRNLESEIILSRFSFIIPQKMIISHIDGIIQEANTASIYHKRITPPKR
jgi:enoyl-[acyl-carrier protein] reductase/trans-2-enoyl-CoA reductase (NAD+)